MAQEATHEELGAVRAWFRLHPTKGEVLDKMVRIWRDTQSTDSQVAYKAWKEYRRMISREP